MRNPYVKLQKKFIRKKFIMAGERWNRDGSCRQKYLVGPLVTKMFGVKSSGFRGSDSWVRFDLSVESLRFEQTNFLGVGASLTNKIVLNESSRET